MTHFLEQELKDRPLYYAWSFRFFTLIALKTARSAFAYYRSFFVRTYPRLYSRGSKNDMGEQRRFDLLLGQKECNNVQVYGNNWAGPSRGVTFTGGAHFKATKRAFRTTVMWTRPFVDHNDQVILDKLSRKISFTL